MAREGQVYVKATRTQGLASSPSNPVIEARHNLQEEEWLPRPADERSCKYEIAEQ